MKQTYTELRITPQTYYALFVELINSLSDEAIEEEGNTIILRSEASLEMMRFGVETFAKELSLALGEDILVDIQMCEKENEDWIARYRHSIQPLHVGDFYIHPSWEPSISGKQNIVIDPALAFGSGHHETTYGCLLMLQKYVRAEQSVLDVGCGSGILALGACKRGAVVDLCDTDEQATTSAQENFTLNGETYHTLWTGSVQKRTQEYDVVIANIIADVLVMIAHDLQCAVKKEGILILSGILDKYIHKVEAKYASSMHIVEKYQKEEWCTLVLQRK